LTSWGWARYCSKHVHVEDCNKCIKKYVHQVGHWLRLYQDARSAKYKKKTLS